MNTAVLLIIGIVVLAAGYLLYGRWLAKQWGVGEQDPTPAHTMEDGQDYVPAKPAVLMGHHFSSIAGAGPINGPIQAAVFGWVPVVLWVLIGGIFFGGVHDFGALFASLRNKGQSIGEIIETAIGARAKKLFLIFAFLTLLLVVAAFASIVASTFQATYTEAGVVDVVASQANASTAMISFLFIVLAIIFGFFVYRRHVPVGISTIIGIVAIVGIVVLGLNWHPIYFDNKTWMIIVGIYIMIASVAPVWILLQPRDYLSSFLLYFMIIVSVIGIFGSHSSMEAMPAFTGFKDTLAPTGNSIGYLFPALFVTIACGAISGFHSLVSSGTTSKQLDKEKDALPIAYGSMLVECLVAIISVCAVSYIWKEYAAGETVAPTKVLARGIGLMLSNVFGGSQKVYDVASSMLVLAVSVFCLTSLDTATRLARYMFQEFWLKPGETWKDVHGAKRVLANPYFATVITVLLGVALGMTGYSKVWALFGAANQLLAVLGLLAVCCWLGHVGKKNWMFYIPMLFMLIVTETSLALTIKSNLTTALARAPELVQSGEIVWYWARGVIAIFLFVLALWLVVEGIYALKKQRDLKKQKA